MIGKIARSTAGHDIGQLYIVVGESASQVHLSDGRLKPVESPKIKNRKHVVILNKKTDPSLRDKIISGDKAANEAIKRAIKLYNREEENV